MYAIPLINYPHLSKRERVFVEVCSSFRLFFFLIFLIVALLSSKRSQQQSEVRRSFRVEISTTAITTRHPKKRYRVIHFDF